jgi:DNA-binding transcriptional ArsR family regulator
VVNQTLSAEVTELHAQLCSALADPKRILILYALAERPYTVNDLAAVVEITQPAASRHLKILRESGLVRAHRQGVSIEYTLNDPQVIQALDLLRGVLRNRLQYTATLVNGTDQPNL